MCGPVAQSASGAEPSGTTLYDFPRRHHAGVHTAAISRQCLLLLRVGQSGCVAKRDLTEPGQGFIRTGEADDETLK